MTLFLCTLQLPVNVWDERTVLSFEEKENHLLNWTTKELDKVYSGEFGWKKLGIFGVCAIQYVNRTKVRLIVKACKREIAEAIVKSFAWHIDAKTEHKRPYSRRCSNAKVMSAGNRSAARHILNAAH